MSKNAEIIRITSRLNYVTSPSARFVSADNISWRVRSEYADDYSDIYLPMYYEPYYDITLSGTVITITVEGLTGRSNITGLSVELMPQFVVYSIEEM